jgi:hypothetical protein
MCSENPLQNFTFNKALGAEPSLNVSRESQNASLWGLIYYMKTFVEIPSRVHGCVRTCKSPPLVSSCLAYGAAIISLGLLRKSSGVWTR